MYKQTAPSTIIGVFHATFWLRTPEDAIIACSIIERCRGMRSVTFITLCHMGAVPSRVRSSSVQKLSIIGAVDFASISLPSLLTLDLQCVLAESRLALYPCSWYSELQNVYIYAHTLIGPLEMCPHVRRLQLELVQLSRVTINPIADLTYLALANVSAAIELQALPNLSTLVLVDSDIHEANPLELIQLALEHDRLRDVAVKYHNPSTLHFWMWTVVQLHTNATGACEQDMVNLHIACPKISSP